MCFQKNINCRAVSLKILQVNKFYHPDIGGVETVVKQYAESVTNDHEVTVLCINKTLSYKTKKETINDVVVIRSSSMGTFFSMPVSLSFFIRFIKLFRKFDIIHFHEPFPLGSLLSFLISNKRKVMVTWHSDIIKQKFLKNIVELFQINLCRKASIISTTSPNLLNFSKVLSKFKEKVVILPLSISITESISQSDDNYILYLGRLSYYKGIDVLLEAYEMATTDMRLLIVGDGDKSIAGQINEYSNKTDKKITFINRFVTEEEKNSFLKNCSFFVLPSIEASEAFAIIQLEAMIHGKAVINTNLPTGVPFVSVHRETGLTVTPNDSQQLAEAIDTLANNKNLRNTLGQEGRKRVVNKFSDQEIIKRLETEYKKM